MAFFKRELSPVERFESALKIKQTGRQKMADRLGHAETTLSEKRAAAERLASSAPAMPGLNALRPSCAWSRIASRCCARPWRNLTNRSRQSSTHAVAQRDREQLADNIEALAAAIELAVPGFSAGAAALVDAVTNDVVSVPQATRFATSVDAVRHEVLSAADLVCWELRTIAVRTRAGNTNSELPTTPPQAAQPRLLEIERQLIYTLNPLLWREGAEVCKVPAFTLVELPKTLLPVALRHKHVDYLNARRVQTLMHVHGSAGSQADPCDDAQLVDLDALAADEQPSTTANVA